MMHDDPQLPAPTQEDPDVIDAVFDRVCPVPEHLCNVAAQQDVIQTVATGTTAGEPVPGEQRDVESSAQLPFVPTIDVDPVMETPVVEESNDDSGTLDKLCGAFDLDCCGKKENVSNETTEVKIDPADVEKNEDPSLSELAARMNDIDLETAGGDSMDESPENYGHVVKSGKVKPWYHETFYATLIVFCSVFSIAIIVMAVLLLTKN
jgi:hypothetical protein